MFEFSLRSAPARRPALDNRACLRFETLEERVVANAAPVICAFYITQHLPNKQVVVTGVVRDEAPTGVTVNFSGVASGSVTCSATGQFTKTLTCSALGSINAVATDSGSLNSYPAVLTVTNNAPVIQNFSAVNTSGNMWTFSGTVADEAPAGLVVTLTSIMPSLTSVQVTVGANGLFSISVLLDQPLDHGTVLANCTDWWGVAADEAETLVA